jgi:hypothetical protein
MRITPQQRHQNITRIRAVMDQMLHGDIPAAGRCDIKTLAREAGVDRAAFYGTRPYAHLREEFEQRLHARQQAGDPPDPHDAQITRLKNEINTLKQRLARHDQQLADLAAFKTTALSQLAAQHDEINRLRRTRTDPGSGNLRHLPTRAAAIGPCN